MYRVISAFRDLQDDGYQYEAGDEYPRAGLSPGEGRVAELMRGNTRTLEPGKPLIEEVAGEDEAVAENATDEEAPKAEAKPKRGKKRKADD